MKGSRLSLRNVPPAAAVRGFRLIPWAALLMALPGALTEARADDLPPLRALLLPTLAKGRGVGKPSTWDGYLADRLTARGYAVDPRPVGADDLKCQALDCLERLRKRTGADLALRVQVVDESLGFKLRLWLVRDGEAHRFDEQSECAQCSPETARAQLDESLRKRLDEASAVPPTRGLDAVIPSAPPAAPATDATPAPPGWLLGADIALGAGLAVGAGLAGVGLYALSRDGAPTCDLNAAGGATQCPQVVDGGTSAGIYLGLGGALLVGSAIGLALVETRYRPKANKSAVATTATTTTTTAHRPRTPWLAPLVPLAPRAPAGIVFGGTF